MIPMIPVNGKVIVNAPLREKLETAIEKYLRKNAPEPYTQKARNICSLIIKNIERPSEE